MTEMNTTHTHRFVYTLVDPIQITEHFFKRHEKKYTHIRYAHGSHFLEKYYRFHFFLLDFLKFKFI